MGTLGLNGSQITNETFGFLVLAIVHAQTNIYKPLFYNIVTKNNLGKFKILQKVPKFLPITQPAKISILSSKFKNPANNLI